MYSVPPYPPLLAHLTGHSSSSHDHSSYTVLATPHRLRCPLPLILHTAIHPTRATWPADHRIRFMNIGALLWGYDAQIGGATLSVPSFRRDFGYTYNGQYVLPASWQSAFNSVSSIGGMFGGLSLGIVAERFG